MGSTTNATRTTTTGALALDDVTVRFGGVVALDGVSFTARPGQLCGLIGPNGAGKTTAFNVVSGFYRPTSGRALLGDIVITDHPPHQVGALGIARTFQNLALFPAMTVLENTMVGAHRHGKQSFLTAPLRIGRRAEEREMRDRAMSILAELDLESVASHPADGLPYGTLKRVELARALAIGGSWLLLDEPANGLTHREVDELADTILAVRETRDLGVLLVEHHIGMVMRLTNHLVVLDFGRKIAEGPPDEVMQDEQVVAAYLGRRRDR